MQLTLYTREQNGIQVHVIQRLSEGKYTYEMTGYVNGELVHSSEINGFRFAAPEGRKLFKELYAANVAPELQVKNKGKKSPEDRAIQLEERMRQKIARQAEAQEKKLQEKELRKQEIATKRAELAAAKAAASEGQENGTVPVQKKKGRKVYSVAEGAVVTDPN